MSAIFARAVTRSNIGSQTVAELMNYQSSIAKLPGAPVEELLEGSVGTEALPKVGLEGAP